MQNLSQDLKKKKKMTGLTSNLEIVNENFLKDFKGVFNVLL